MARNPHYLSQLAHLEIVSPDLDASVRFFTDIAGLDETGRDGTVGLPPRLGRLLSITA